MSIPQIVSSILKVVAMCFFACAMFDEPVIFFGQFAMNIGLIKTEGTEFHTVIRIMYAITATLIGISLVVDEIQSANSKESKILDNQW